MVKRMTVTYALWAMAGPLGLHHLYLGRDSHALLWMLTFGGFGLGWSRDFYRIPAYVSEANKVAAGVRRRPGPPAVGPVRLAGQVCVGIYFGAVALISLNTLNFFYLLVLPLSVGVGVHLVSSVGQQTSDLHKTVIACVITSPIFYGNSLAPLPISLAGSFTAAQHCRFKPPQSPGHQKLVPRVTRLALAWLAFCAPLGYCIFHNTTATLYYISDCLAALLNVFWFLPWLRGVVEYLLLIPYRMLCFFTGGGFTEEAWEKVLQILLRKYSQQEREALKVLALTEEATLEDITHSYRKLVKVWHPDRNPGQVAQAQEMFLKIQEAYEILLQRHKLNRRK